MRHRSEPSGSLAPTSALAISGRPAWCSVHRRSPPLAGAGSSSPGLASSPEFRPLEPARRAHAASASLGVSSLHRDVSVGSPLGGRVPVPAYVPPAVFLTPSTAFSSSHLASLFHPATASEISSSGAFPDDQPAGFVTRPCPPVVGGLRLRPGCPVRASSGRPVSRALIQSPIRHRHRSVKTGRDPFPS